LKYIETAEHFARWYRDMAEKAGHKGHKVNLIALLAKVYAVFAATNIPEHLKEGPGSGFTGVTSKDRQALTLARGFTAQGKKTVIFASSPDTLRKLERLFATAGIETATYDGTIPIGKRTKLIRGWKKGSVPVLLATYGAAQLGLNWAMGSRVIAYNRAWSPRIEEQAFARVLRPQQQDEVEIHYLELQGSIDVYMRQLVEQKDSAAAAGIDYEDQMAEEDFLHLDTVIGRFVEGLAKDLGYASGRDLKQAISG
jgi:SNF2 family DNA or RNA helicase